MDLPQPSPPGATGRSPTPPLLPDTHQRLAAAAAGADLTRHLALGLLAPGDVGVVSATVVRIEPSRSYQRKRGGEGQVARAVLRDATGEATLVLWDDEAACLRDGSLHVGARVVLRGAQVRPGWRGGVELGLAGARLELSPAGPAEATGRVVGRLVEVGATRIVETPGAPPAFECDVTLQPAAGPPQRVVLRGEPVKRVRGLALGSRVAVSAVAPNPALDGWWWSTEASLLHLDPPDA